MGTWKNGAAAREETDNIGTSTKEAETLLRGVDLELRNLNSAKWEMFRRRAGTRTF